MNTVVFNNVSTNDIDIFNQAADIIRKGGLVAFPTETVYGLGANALDEDAVRSIFAAKGRPQDNPLIAHISDVSDLGNLVKCIPDSAIRLSDKFWPGPLTMVLPRRPEVPDAVTAGLDTVGVRCPSHPIARAFIRACGCPIAAPSANTSGKPSPTNAADVFADMNGRIKAILDGGNCSVGVESTVISLVGDVPRLLRPGGVTLEQLESVLGYVEVDKAIYLSISNSERVSAPGMKYRHYAPVAPVTVLSGYPDKTAEYIRSNETQDTGIICFDEYQNSFRSNYIQSLGSSNSSTDHAQRIFSALRYFDKTPVVRILAQCPEREDGVDLAVANRLKKAAGFNVISL